MLALLSMHASALLITTVREEQKSMLFFDKALQLTMHGAACPQNPK
jgi:hypothetical protein